MSSQEKIAGVIGAIIILVSLVVSSIFPKEKISGDIELAPSATASPLDIPQPAQVELSFPSASPSPEPSVKSTLTISSSEPSAIPIPASPNATVHSIQNVRLEEDD